MLGKRVAHGAEGRHFSHAPGVDHSGIEFLLETLHHCSGGGRSSDHYAFKAKLFAGYEASGLRMLLERHPYGRNTQRHSHAFVSHQGIEAGAIKGRAWQDQLGPA
ncbi:hypothetical protein D3C84_1038470 [compost metagenome]